MTDAAVSDRENRTVSVTTRLEWLLAARVFRAAEADGRSVSNWMRLAALKKLEELTDG